MEKKHALPRKLRSKWPARLAGAAALALVASGAAFATGGDQATLISDGAAPALPPAQICGSPSELDGPSSAPAGAVTIPSGDNTVDLSENWNISANTTYWLAPGTHTLGLGAYDQIEPKDGDTFVGAPGAILDGQSSNNSAFVGSATDVTVEYLTIQDFVPPGTQYVVNHDMGADWTVEHNTIQDNGDTAGSQLGAGLGLGDNNVVEYNCITHNGEYAMNAGGDNTVFSDNEVSWNGISFFPDDSGCGCSGGIKYWDTTGATVEDNYIHDNYNVGLWFDTDNTGALVQGNWISGNWAEGIIYEISYNADFNANTFVDNGWGIGSSHPGGVPYGAAIYLNGSGGDANVPGNYSGSLDVTNNVFTDNWDGVIAYQNPNRLCGSGSNASTGYCTLDNPSVFTTTSCPANDGSGSASENPDYFDGCQWKAQNITVSGNDFNFNPADITSATPSLPMEQVSDCPDSPSALAAPETANTYWCGFNGMFSLPGSGTGGPSAGWTVVDAIMNLTNSTGEAGYNNHWSDNTYNGPWTFQAAAQGQSPVQTDINPNGIQATLDFAQWQSVWGQDQGSTSNTTPGAPPPSIPTTTAPAATTTTVGSTTTSAPTTTTGVAKTTSTAGPGTTTVAPTTSVPRATTTAPSTPTTVAGRGARPPTTTTTVPNTTTSPTTTVVAPAPPGTTAPTTTTAPTITTPPTTTTTAPPKGLPGRTSGSVRLAGKMVTATGTSVAVAPKVDGGLMLLSVDTNNSAPPTVTAVKGGGVAKWSLAGRFLSNGGYDTEIWTGVVTTTGASTVKVSLSGYSNRTDLVAQELSARSGLHWKVVEAGTATDFGSTWYFPGLTAKSGEFYFGIGLRNDDGTLSSGGTPGYTYRSTGLSGSELVVYGTTRTGLVEPAGHNSDYASYEDSVGVLISAAAHPAKTTKVGVTGPAQDQVVLPIGPGRRAS
jgi:hypothetical protein